MNIMHSDNPRQRNTRDLGLVSGPGKGDKSRVNNFVIYRRRLAELFGAGRRPATEEGWIQRRPGRWVKRLPINPNRTSIEKEH